MVSTDAALEQLAPLGIRRLTRAQYECLIEAGQLEDARVELLRGLTQALGDRAEVFSHTPFPTSEDSMPESDVYVVAAEDYSHARPERAYLVVEVAFSSHDRDRRVKAALYAEAGVPEYWLVDVPARKVEVRRQPSSTGYGSVETFGDGDTLTMPGFPDVSLSISDVLPSR